MKLLNVPHNVNVGSKQNFLYYHSLKKVIQLLFPYFLILHVQSRSSIERCSMKNIAPEFWKQKNNFQFQQNLYIKRIPTTKKFISGNMNYFTAFFKDFVQFLEKTILKSNIVAFTTVIFPLEIQTLNFLDRARQFYKPNIHTIFSVSFMS